MGIYLNDKEEENYQAFIKGLEKLSKKYGIGISGCGVISYTDENGFKSITYTNDSSSGDIFIRQLTFSDGEKIEF